MAKKGARKDEQECPGCGKTAKCVIQLANGYFKSVHSFKNTHVRSSATGIMIACQVPDRICTNSTELIEEEL